MREKNHHFALNSGIPETLLLCLFYIILIVIRLLVPKALWLNLVLFTKFLSLSLSLEAFIYWLPNLMAVSIFGGYEWNWLVYGYLHHPCVEDVANRLVD